MSVFNTRPSVARGLGWARTSGPRFRVLVDWPDSGLFTEAGVDVTGRVKGRSALVAEFGKDKIRSLDPPAAGTGSFVLDNRSKDYSLLNLNSPLAAYATATDPSPVTVGHDVEFQYLDPVSGAWKNFAYLVTDDMPQNPDPDKLDVDMPCIGFLSKLRGTPSWSTSQSTDTSSTFTDPGGVSTALYQNITIDVAIGYLLDAAGWPAGRRRLDVSTVVLQWYWEESADPLKALVVLMNTEGAGAALYEDANGNIVFESNNHRYSATASTTSNAAYTDGSAPGPGGVSVYRVQYPFMVQTGVKDVVNAVSVDQKVRSAKATTTVWNGPSSVTIAPSVTYTVTAKVSDPFTSAIPPVAGTDFTVTAGAVAGPATLSRTSGQSTLISITAGAAGATITNLGLRAQPVTVDSTTQVVNSINTSASQARYGTKPYKLQTRSEIDTNTLQGQVDNIATLWSNPQPYVMVTLTEPVVSPGADLSKLGEIWGRSISDRVSVVEAQTMIAVDGWIDKIHREVSHNGQLFTAQYWIEFVIGLQPFKLDTDFMDGQSPDQKHVLWS